MFSVDIKNTALNQLLSFGQFHHQAYFQTYVNLDGVRFDITKEDIDIVPNVNIYIYIYNSMKNIRHLIGEMFFSRYFSEKT